MYELNISGFTFGIHWGNVRSPNRANRDFMMAGAELGFTGLWGVSKLWKYGKYHNLLHFTIS